ncbi:RNA 2',3'-cyclic phosphodiesterase [Candidatus Pacearchaeota archaeon]|nr:RNA 2',3'-cyclic phosphodiesterase [Candidatus Pacearchaeota archaeon]
MKKIQDALPEFVGKKIEPENLHLTLKFLGEIDDNKVEEIKKRLSGLKFKKFETEISSIGVFYEKIIRIVWLHLTNCGALQKEIDNSLKDLFTPEQRFMSHLTIARVKNVDDKKEFLEKLKKIKIPKISFVVENFKLKSSMLNAEGPVYDDIEKYSLK